MIQNNIVSTPISLSELAQLLGTSQDVGRICTSPNINMWSKFKPVHDTELFSNHDGKGSSGNYGIAPYYGIMSNIKSKTNGGLNGWTYSKPLGGSLSPFRIGDFRGYCHDALPPFAKLSTNVANGKLSIDESLSIAGFMPEKTDYNITLDMLSAFGGSNAFYGILLYSGSTNKAYLDTESIAQKNGHFSIEIAATEFALSKTGNSENWTLCPLIAVKNGTNSYTYYTIPYMSVVPFTLSKAPSYSIIVKARVNTAGTLLTVDAWGKSNKAASFHSIDVRVRFSNKGYSDALTSGERRVTFDGPVEISGTAQTSLFSTLRFGTGTNVEDGYRISQEVLNNAIVYVQAVTPDGALLASAVPLRIQQPDRDIIQDLTPIIP